jgi:hypothetical protein
MAILPPDQSSSLLKSKNFAYDESFKDYNQKKKSEIQALRQQQKEDRQKAKELKKNRTDNLNQSSDVISNNTPGDQKPEGINKFGPVINAQTKKIIGIVTPNALALAANYINLTDVCPSEQTTRNTLNQFNNIVKDINNTVEGVNKVANISQLASTGVNTIQQISTALQTTIPIASAAAKTIPLVPGFVVSLLDDLDYVNNKLLYKSDGTAKLPPIIAGANALTLGISLFSLTLRNLASTITGLTLALQKCLPEADHKNIEQLSATTNQYLSYGNDNYDDFDTTSYQGFDIKIEEIPYTPTVIRKKAVGYNSQGIPLIQTELSFTSNSQTLVSELKLIIDRDNLKAY